MATLIGKESRLIDTLKNLIELDFDAINAYQAAIDRLDSPIFKTAMREFMADHERHIQELTGVVLDMGDAPPTKGDLKSILTKGKVLIGQITGDAGILSAMHSNEEDTNTAYERSLSRDDVIPPNIFTILARALEDERRHKAWIERALVQNQQMGTSSSLAAN